MDDLDLMIELEGLKLLAYDCPAGFRTVGIGFNMENPNAQRVWEKLDIKEDFDKVFYKEIEISKETAIKLFNHTWKWCIKQAKKRADELGLDYNAMPEYKQFILADIVYNTGSIKKWRKVLINKEPKSVLYEARRHPYFLMDNRVAKIGYFWGIIKDLDEAHKLGLEYATLVY